MRFVADEHHFMKVSKLIKLLSEVNQDAEVFLSSDAEGNSFNTVADVHDEGGNLAFNGKTGSGSVIFGVLQDDGSEDPVYKKPAVILYP